MIAFATGSRLIPVRMRRQDQIVMMKAFGLLLPQFLGELLLFFNHFIEKIYAELIDHLLGLYKKIEAVLHR